LAVVGALVGAAQADIPQLRLACWPEGASQTWWNPPGVDNGNNTYSYQGTRTASDWRMDWTVLADRDPFVNAVLGVTNLSAVTQTYTMITLLPIAPALTPASLIGGSTGGSVTDSNFDGIGGLSTAAGTPLYNGLADLVGVLPIYNHPYGVNFAFAGQTISIPSVNVGLPGPSIPNGAILSTIGIKHVFTLSPGDSASFTSFFVAVTPEPASLLLLGLLAIARRR
jgi:hypothetical protein